MRASWKALGVPAPRQLLGVSQCVFRQGVVRHRRGGRPVEVLRRHRAPERVVGDLASRSRRRRRNRTCRRHRRIRRKIRRAHHALCVSGDLTPDDPRLRLARIGSRDRGDGATKAVKVPIRMASKAIRRHLTRGNELSVPLVLVRKRDDCGIGSTHDRRTRLLERQDSPEAIVSGSRVLPARAHGHRFAFDDRIVGGAGWSWPMRRCRHRSGRPPSSAYAGTPSRRCTSCNG